MVLDVSPEFLERLDELAERTCLATRCEVLRRAVRLFAEVVEAEMRGAQVFFRDDDGTLTHIVPLLCPPAGAEGVQTEEPV